MTGATPGSITAEGEPCINSVRAANIAWWNEDIPLPLEDDTKKLFVEYSKIPEDKLEQHLLEAVRFPLSASPSFADSSTLPAPESMGLMSLPMHRPMAFSQASA